MSGVRCSLVLVVCAAVSGCLLPDFQNGPAPASSGLPDASAPPDAQEEWNPPEDAAQEPDGPFLPDAADDPALPDAAEEPDVVLMEAGFCEAHPDGTICGSGNACNERVCQLGACVLVPIPNGVECAPAPNACYLPGRCNAGVCGNLIAHPEGYNWDPSDTWRRCCGGQALRMDTKDNCGVCGIKCSAGDGQSCKINSVNDMYYCEGCTASASCWSGCCATTYGQPYRCAASDCAGQCITCPSGSSCVSTPGEASLVCAYD